MSNKFNAGDEEQVKGKREKAKLARSMELSDLHAVMGTQEGRRFVWRVLNMASIFTTTFTGNSTTFFNEGARSLGLKVLADLMEPSLQESYLLMQFEAMKALKEEAND